MVVFIAKLNAGLLNLNAYGQTKELARQALQAGIESCALKYRLSSLFLGAKEEDIQYEEVALGQCYEIDQQFNSHGKSALNHESAIHSFGGVEPKILLAEAAMNTPKSNLVTQSRIDCALDIAKTYGGFDGAHHKAWAIDQMCRALLGDEYDAFVASAKAGEEGPETYEWDVGLAP